MKRKWINISLWTLLFIGLGFSLYWLNIQSKRQNGSALYIHVKEDHLNYFLSNDDIRILLRERGDTVIHQPLNRLNIRNIEASLNNHPAIADAQVYVTIDGKVNVEITQRTPIVRLVDRSNDSYYIDDNGKLMPLSDKFTSNVLIVSGDFRIPYGRFYNLNLDELAKKKNYSDSSHLVEIYSLAKFIWTNEFWKAQVQQVNLNANGEFEMIPRVGDQKIVLGHIEDLEEKFSKLFVFYTQGLNPTGWWNKYSIINLKYKDQIVCTKKDPQNS